MPKEPFADGTECRISGWGATETCMFPLSISEFVLKYEMTESVLFSFLL